MRDKEIKIRSANSNDCEDVYVWRSDPISRSMSFNKLIPSFEEHRNWFEDLLTNVNRKFHIGERNASKIGVCRFDHNTTDSTVTVSINMNPASKGCGFGNRFLASSSEHHQKNHQYDLLAEVKPEHVRNHRPQTSLSEDEYTQLEADWQKQPELHEQLKDKPSELNRYQHKPKQARFC